MDGSDEIEAIRTTLARHRDRLRAMHVRSLAVFGSRARGDARAGSDLDLLVEFTQPVGLIHFSRLKSCLSELLGCEVDLATKGGLHPALKSDILKDARQVA